MSKTLVIGGGLLGLCTAKALADKGIEVEVLEAREAVGMETSFANGGMLTPSLPDPWNAPGVYRHLVASLFDPKSSMKLHLSSIPSLLSWGLGFLRNSSPGRFYESVESNYHLARYSLDLTAVWRERLQFDYCAGTGLSEGFSRMNPLCMKTVSACGVRLFGPRGTSNSIRRVLWP